MLTNEPIDVGSLISTYDVLKLIINSLFLFIKIGLIPTYDVLKVIYNKNIPILRCYRDIFLSSISIFIFS